VQQGEAAEEDATREGRAVGAYLEGDREEGDGEESEPTVNDFLGGVGKIASWFEGFAAFGLKALEGEGEGVI